MKNYKYNYNPKCAFVFQSVFNNRFLHSSYNLSLIIRLPRRMRAFCWSFDIGAVSLSPSVRHSLSASSRNASIDRSERDAHTRFAVYWNIQNPPYGCLQWLGKMIYTSSRKIELNWIFTLLRFHDAFAHTQSSVAYVLYSIYIEYFPRAREWKNMLACACVR